MKKPALYCVPYAVHQGSCWMSKRSLKSKPGMESEKEEDDDEVKRQHDARMKWMISTYCNVTKIWDTFHGTIFQSNEARSRVLEI